MTPHELWLHVVAVVLAAPSTLTPVDGEGALPTGPRPRRRLVPRRQRGPPTCAEPVGTGGGQPLVHQPATSRPSNAGPESAVAPAGCPDGSPRRKEQPTEQTTQSDGGPQLGVNFQPLQRGQFSSVVDTSLLS